MAEVKDLFAFWKYDLFPYVLGGPIGEIDDKGFVFATTYRLWFKPIKILPLQAGIDLWSELEKLKRNYKATLEDIKEECKEELLKIMPEALGI